jgi:hypothetical protein
MGALTLVTGVLLSVALSAMIARSAGSKNIGTATRQKEIAQA